MLALFGSGLLKTQAQTHVVTNITQGYRFVK